MRQTTYIRSFLAGFLLLVFCLGITPKQILHDLLTNHVHVPAKNHSEATIDLQPSKYVCDFHDQVAESPFIPVETREIAPAVVYLDNAVSFFHESVACTVVLHSNLRGPPALA
ncbi:MAG: hypothetical protein EOO09_01660 [Chitinophagaceae bacterium]|nr:MAG: hypothetical protein EOO09_01660 [Chitinophagaceae bacterium]